MKGIITNDNVIIPNWCDGLCALLESGRCKITNDKVLAHLGFKTNVLPGTLYYLSEWLGLRTSILQQGIKCQFRYWEGWALISLVKFRRQSSCQLVFK
jgi:hypothetical protein